MKQTVLRPVARMFLAALVVMSLLCGCVADEGLTEDPAVYWNAEMGAVRIANADGTYTIKVAKDGAAVDLVVADRATLDAIDKLQIFGVSTNEGGVAAAVRTVEDMGYTQLTGKRYVQLQSGKLLKLNTDEDMLGQQTTVETDKETGCYDMSGCSEFIGAATKLQAADQVIVLQKNSTVTHVFVAGRDGIIQVKTDYCQACKKDVQWSNWFDKDTLPAEQGHYYLDVDINLTDQLSIASGTLCLDLNGKTVRQTAEGKNIYTLDGSSIFNLIDTDGDKQGTLIPNNALPDGELADQYPWGQVFEVGKEAALNIFGGTLDAAGVRAQCGVCIHNRGMVNLYDGKLIGGVSWSSGAAAICNQGSFNMFGGEVVGGRAAKESGDCLGGGAIRITQGAVMNMTGGTITGGRSDTTGGNLSVAGTVYITGGSVVGGEAAQRGGNIYVHKTGKLTIGPGMAVEDIAYEGK